MNKQKEMIRFKDKEDLGLCLPHGTWTLDLG